MSKKDLLASKLSNQLVSLVKEAVNNAAEEYGDLLPEYRKYPTKAEASKAYADYISKQTIDDSRKTWRSNVKTFTSSEETLDGLFKDDKYIIELLKDFNEFAQKDESDEVCGFGEFVVRGMKEDRFNTTAEAQNVDNWVKENVLENKLHEEDREFLQSISNTLASTVQLWFNYMTSISTQPLMGVCMLSVEMQSAFLTLKCLREDYNLTKRPITSAQLAIAVNVVSKHMNILTGMSKSLQEKVWFNPNYLIEVLVENIVAERVMERFDCPEEEKDTENAPVVEDFFEWLSALASDEPNETKKRVSNLLDKFLKESGHK